MSQFCQNTLLIYIGFTKDVKNIMIYCLVLATTIIS